MAVILVPKFNKAEIKKLLQERRERIEAAILLRLKRTGEAFVAKARSTNTYQDQTGNLRSSIGYVILHNGQQLFESFPGSGEGQEAAKEATDKAKADFPTGFVLIGVAGMDYAAAVEAMGFDVITSSSLQAETTLKAALKDLQNKVERMA